MHARLSKIKGDCSCQVTVSRSPVTTEQTQNSLLRGAWPTALVHFPFCRALFLHLSSFLPSVFQPSLIVFCSFISASNSLCPTMYPPSLEHLWFVLQNPVVASPVEPSCWRSQPSSVSVTPDKSCQSVFLLVVDYLLPSLPSGGSEGRDSNCPSQGPQTGAEYMGRSRTLSLAVSAHTLLPDSLWPPVLSCHHMEL